MATTPLAEAAFRSVHVPVVSWKRSAASRTRKDSRTRIQLANSTIGAVRIRVGSSSNIDAVRRGVRVLIDVLLVPGSDVPLEVPPSDQHFPAQIAFVRRFPVRVQPHVLVQVARVAERPQTVLAFQWFVAGVCPKNTNNSSQTETRERKNRGNAITGELPIIASNVKTNGSLAGVRKPFSRIESSSNHLMWIFSPYFLEYTLPQ